MVIVPFPSRQWQTVQVLLAQTTRMLTSSASSWATGLYRNPYTALLHLSWCPTQPLLRFRGVTTSRPMPLHEAVRLHQLQKTYVIPGRTDTAIYALDQVSLMIPPATFTAVVGPSGCGKSTLLHCTAGLDRPTAGEIDLLGTRITALKPAQLAAFRARHLGFVFQDDNLISSLTAFDNVALPGRLAGRGLPRQEVMETLAMVGMEHRAQLRPHQLSGGERQRIAVARVMASRPPLVFADEPTGALDISSGAVVMGWLRSLTDLGTTVVMVTHDVGAAAAADTVVVMQAGTVRATIPGGNPHDIEEQLHACRATPGLAAALAGPAS
ncbi:ABC transporter ATP-binding protein [Deinococcus hohokamensis]|uniref:ABC transporter ATP-binding protein n=1 Tax=Deinococcus hohokamensis TaxID=309883 RepID=A0ABV9I660_9DEIO